MLPPLYVDLCLFYIHTHIFIFMNTFGCAWCVWCVCGGGSYAETERYSKYNSVSITPKCELDLGFMDALANQSSSSVTFDSALYVGKMDYQWHALERYAFKAHAEAIIAEPTATKMYFDGLCPLCTKEVALYKNLAAKDPNSLFRLIDINGPAGDPDGELATVWGVTRQQALARIHVVEGDVLRTGIAGFVAVWKALPYWKHLAVVFDTVRGETHNSPPNPPVICVTREDSDGDKSLYQCPLDSTPIYADVRNSDDVMQQRSRS